MVAGVTVMVAIVGCCYAVMVIVMVAATPPLLFLLCVFFLMHRFRLRCHGAQG